MFMHNGDVSGFSKIRRGLQADLRDDLFDHMSGTTDSELLFLLILNQLPDCHTQQDPTTLQQAVMKAFCRVIRANEGAPNSLNVAFTDGETVIATRYRNSDHEEPPACTFTSVRCPASRRGISTTEIWGASRPWRRTRGCTISSVGSRREAPTATGGASRATTSSSRRRRSWCLRSL